MYNCVNTWKGNFGLKDCGKWSWKTVLPLPFALKQSSSSPITHLLPSLGQAVALKLSPFLPQLKRQSGGHCHLVYIHFFPLCISIVVYSVCVIWFCFCFYQLFSLSLFFFSITSLFPRVSIPSLCPYSIRTSALEATYSFRITVF